jgi:hypothetical protein
MKSPENIISVPIHNDSKLVRTEILTITILNLVGCFDRWIFRCQFILFSLFDGLQNPLDGRLGLEHAAVGPLYRFSFHCCGFEDLNLKKSII